MSKSDAASPSAADAVAALLEDLRLKNAEASKIVRQIEAAQLPLLEQGLEILRKKPFLTALPLIEELLKSLTDAPANALANLAAHGSSAESTFTGAIERINAQIVEDSKPAE